MNRAANALLLLFGIPALFVLAALLDLLAVPSPTSAASAQRAPNSAARRWVALACLLLAATCLPACGGGDPEDQDTGPEQHTNPPACAQSPELCK